MPYSDIPRVSASFLDGAFRVPRTPTQPNILIVGPANSGETNEKYNITNSSVAENEFGRATPVMRVMHELLTQGADNVSVIRSGGTQGNIVITDSTTAATLTITPQSRDDEILDRYALVIENDGTDNRYLVYDLTDQAWVYDSSEILAIDDGTIDIDDTGYELCTCGSLTDPDTLPALGDTANFVLASFSPTANSINRTEGTDGTTPSLVERYAAYNSTYHLLDFRDADYVIPCDVYVDDDNVADDATFTYAGTGTTDGEKYGYFFKGIPAAGDVLDHLGFVWQYVYQGKLYTYFVDCDDYFAGETAGAVKATVTVDTDIVLTAAKFGKGGNAISYSSSDSGGGITTTIAETDHGLTIAVAAEVGVDTTDAIKDDINTELGSFTLRNGDTADSLVVATGGAAVTTHIAEGASPLVGGSGGHVLTHADLTGDTIPSAVSTKFSAGDDVELREVNFGHQLASFCYLASTNWSAMMGVVGMKPPSDGYSRGSVRAWAGNPPTYTDQGTFEYIDSPSDNGSGLLGNKFLAGSSKTSAGYRNPLVTDGDSTDSYAYGGFILTNGANLPNGADHPYGIDDSDEAEDSGGLPVDIGKHLFVVYDHLVLSTGYNGGTTYRGTLGPSFIGKLATMPINEEPIGINGTMSSISSPPRIHSTQLSQLANLRMIGIRREDATGQLVVVSAKTAAHPDSDYTRSSTMRAINEHLSGLRNIARPYIGKPFTAQRLVSLQSAIDAYLVDMRSNQMNNGARARIEYSRTDRILGNLTIVLRIVPPFSIENIDVSTSLAADESEL